MNHLWLLAAVLLAAPQQDRTRVQAALSQETVAVRETVVLSISVETPASGDIQIRNPALPNLLMVVGTQESSQVHYAIPGGRRRVLTRELVLQAAAPGTFNIPATEVDVGGNVYRTQPLTLRVTSSTWKNAARSANSVL